MRCFIFIALLAALAFVAPTPAHAQVASIRVEVDKHLVAPQEAVTITVRLTIEGRAGYSQYAPPTMKGLRVSSGGMSSQRLEVINFRVRRRESYSYTAYPMEVGQLKIGPAAIRVGDKWVRSNTVTITVKKNAGGGNVAPGSPPSDHTSGTPGRPTTPVDPTAPGADGRTLPRVFLRGVATPRKVYVGQQVLVHWELYTQSDVLGFRTLRQPTTDGFWADDLRSPRRLQFARKVLQSRVYYVAALAKKALFPQRPGKLKVGPMAAMVRTLNSFSGSAKRQSEELEIEVLPLPEQGKPKGFAEQNVGRYSLAATLDRKTVKAGDAVTLRIVIRGAGNLRQLAMPKLGTVPGFKVYEPKAKERINNSRQIEGEKVLEYLLLPTRSGKLTIPPLQLDYFDPKAARYRKARSRALRLMVSGKLPGGNPLRGGAKSNVLSRDIRPPRPARKLSHRAPTGPLGPLRLALVLLPLLALLTVAGGERLRARLARQTERSLGRAAARRVREHLTAAKEKQRAGDAASCFGEAAAALREQLAHQMGERTEGLTREELRERMATLGFDATLIEELSDELDSCDFARFAPSASGGRQLEQAVDRCRDLVRRIGRTRVAKANGAQSDRKHPGGTHGGKQAGGKQAGGKQAGGKRAGGKRAGGKRAGGKRAGGKQSGGAA